MKIALTALLLFFTASLAVGQTMCKGLRFVDKGILYKYDYPYNKFKKYDNTDIVPDSVKKRIEEVTIKETSRAFFKKLAVKKVLVFDSTVKKRLFDASRYRDEKGYEIEQVYSFLYELKLNDSIPFLFRVDYDGSGELMRKFQLESIEPKRLKIVNCDKAIETALADKTETMHGIDQTFLIASPAHKTLVYQINSVMDPETSMVYIKYINAYNGKLIGRENYKVELQVLEETKIGPLKIEN
jgi:hypothetical protein